MTQKPYETWHKPYMLDNRWYNPEVVSGINYNEPVNHQIDGKMACESCINMCACLHACMICNAVCMLA